MNKEMYKKLLCYYLKDFLGAKEEDKFEVVRMYLARYRDVTTYTR
jgi:hypothetical protein